MFYLHVTRPLCSLYNCDCAILVGIQVRRVQTFQKIIKQHHNSKTQPESEAARGAEKGKCETIEMRTLWHLLDLCQSRGVDGARGILRHATGEMPESGWVFECV